MRYLKRYLPQLCKNDKIIKGKNTYLKANLRKINRRKKEMSQKKLGFGLMRLPSLDPNDASKIDIEQTKKMVDHIYRKRFYIF